MDTINHLTALCLTIAFLQGASSQEFLDMDGGGPNKRYSHCSPGSQCVQSSGCHYLARLASQQTDLFDEDFTYRYPIQHVEGLKEEFGHRLTELQTLIDETKSSWETTNMMVPMEEWISPLLRPNRSLTQDLTNTPPGHAHRVLREARWLLTSIEHSLQLVHSSNLLATQRSGDLVRISARVSGSLNLLMGVFDIPLTSLPHSAICRRYDSSGLTDSITNRAQFTSLTLRDAAEAMQHINTVMNACRVSRHTEGTHSVRLRCARHHHSVFYQSVPPVFRWYTSNLFQ